MLRLVCKNKARVMFVKLFDVYLMLFCEWSFAFKSLGEDLNRDDDVNNILSLPTIPDVFWWKIFWDGQSYGHIRCDIFTEKLPPVMKLKPNFIVSLVTLTWDFYIDYQSCLADQECFHIDQHISILLEVIPRLWDHHIFDSQMKNILELPLE